MRRTVALGVLFGVLASLLLTSSASACATASLTLPSSAGPGDTVWFSISGIEPGATYSLELNGREVASGTNDTAYNGVSGTFTMPDFGTQSLTVTGIGHTFHAADNDSQDPSKSMAYVPPSSAPAPITPARSDAPESKTAHAKREAQPQRAIVTANHAAKKQGHDSPSTVTGVGGSPSESVGSEPGPSNPSAGSGEAKGSAEESSGASDPVLDAIGSTTEVGPAKVPNFGLLLMVLVFVAGTALAAFAIYLLQTGPDPKAAVRNPAPLGPDPAELELQEMIADEMARQMLRELEVVEPPVSR
jgi:hypothetical protein